MLWLRPDRMVRVSLRRCLRPPRELENGLIVLERQQGTSKSAGVVFFWFADVSERASWLAELLEFWTMAHRRRKPVARMDELKQLLVSIGMSKWHVPLTEYGVSMPSDLTILEKADFEKLKMTAFERSKLLKGVYSEDRAAKMKK